MPVPAIFSEPRSLGPPLLLLQDDKAEVTPWENGVRTITFYKPLQMPAFVKQMIGVEHVVVREKQSLVWQGSGQLSITSETQVTNIAGKRWEVGCEGGRVGGVPCA